MYWIVGGTPSIRRRGDRVTRLTATAMGAKSSKVKNVIVWLAGLRAKRTHLPFRVLRQVHGYPSICVQGLSIAMFFHHKSEHVDIVAMVEFLDFRANCILTQICEDHLFNAL